MRLNHIKLAGFKSFVDPTSIGTPGQLVGIVGPNGCGKSNVIDAVRWVLGESKASALRGDSMQDVIFNGARERQAAGRASVEMEFNNEEGRIGGRWGQYTEIAIQRVLTRDGESSYYINSIPVRRRDIHDLFLGTGLGPGAYAIIEQGTITRIVEAKPEELRVFLEEAAGISKYKERRKETEGRLADARQNLSRVEDIRLELTRQLEKLEDQARVASEHREIEASLKHAQQLLWFSKQQDAMRVRERYGTEIASLTVALKGLHAEVQSIATKLEHLRADHHSAGHALHDKQGRFYAANAEVTRLEQQLSFTRESETRITHQVVQLNERIGALEGQVEALAEDRARAEQAIDTCLSSRKRALADEQQAGAVLPPLEEALRGAQVVVAQLQQKIALSEQAIRVIETKRDNLRHGNTQLAQRRQRLESELASLQPPVSAQVEEVQTQLAQEREELASKEAEVAALRASVQDLQERRIGVGETTQQAQRALADIEAWVQALVALQATIGGGKDHTQWLQEHGLADAPRLFSVIKVDPTWNDALEAVLRERLDAIELPELSQALEWVAGGAAVSGRVAAFAAGGNDELTTTAEQAPPDGLRARVRTSRPHIERLLADWLRGVRSAQDLDDALRRREELSIGESFVTPRGHLVSAHAISFFAPDDALHGVLARERELSELEPAMIVARERATSAQRTQAAVDAELDATQKAYHAQSMAFSSQQRRCHNLELELMQLRQAADAAERRRAQITAELVDVRAQEASEVEQAERLRSELAGTQSGLHDELAREDIGRHVRNEAELALARGREHLRTAERAAQDAAFAERSARDRLVEFERRRDSLRAQLTQQQQMLAELASERRAIDWAPVEEALQRQLAAPGEAEQALAAARDKLESLGAELRAAEEARLTTEQHLEPARAKIEEMRLKEQAAEVLEQQYAEQLAQSYADVLALPDALKAFGSSSWLPAEIERLQKAIEDFGAVNLAALDELGVAQERKQYLDAQAAELTGAMATLEHATRQIDEESRRLLQQTFDTVKENFARLFPALFGGGQAQLLLTGEEILDSGIQVVVQPPGKRNTSIHLLSGGEKAVTAIAFVFALFQLNPAPFCLLDEVDAPLDDPNTDRFCKMVRAMSGQTQFLFVSHNKITMEMAGQLVGITMPEPGVSRVVQLDVAETLGLAETGAT